MVLSLPRMGERPMMTEASADLTCWLASDTSSCGGGRKCGHWPCGAVHNAYEPGHASAFALVTHGAGDGSGYEGTCGPNPKASSETSRWPLRGKHPASGLGPPTIAKPGRLALGGQELGLRPAVP